MKDEKYIKILKKIKRYDLFSDVKDYNTWIKSLNRRQVNNFLMLDIDELNPADKKMLIDKDFLNSKYYLKDVEFLIKTLSDSKKDALFTVAKDRNSIKSKYHISHMQYIFNATDDETIKHLVKACTNYNSINNPNHIHTVSMIAICNDKLKEKAFLNMLCTCDKTMYKYFAKDSRKILSSDSNIAMDLSYTATCKKSINGPYHDYEIEKICNSKNSKASELISLLSYNDASINSSNYISDIQSLADAENLGNLYLIFLLSYDEYMINSSYHNDEVKCAFNSKNDVVLACLASLIFNEEIRKSPFYTQNIELVSRFEDGDLACNFTKYLLDENEKFKNLSR